MTQSTVRSRDPTGELDPPVEQLDLLDCLASQALTWVAERTRTTPSDLDGSALGRLHAAAIGPDMRACRDVAQALVADGLTPERICDVHIPDAARRMGEEWVGDDLSFSTVTIGTARLQALLRELDLDFVGRPERGVGAAGAILLVIPPGADHTLGPLLLASQLRRKGFSVRLSLGETPEAVAEATASARFDAVFLSAATPGSLPHLGRSAAAIRLAVSAPPPVVLGGAVMAKDDLAGGGAGEGIGQDPERAHLAAIDHVTSDLDEALRLCGLDVAR